MSKESDRSFPSKVKPYPLPRQCWPPVDCRSNDSNRCYQTSARNPPRSKKASSVDGLECGRASNAQSKMKQKSSKSRPGIMTTSKPPLLFTFNVNGSMVDIRCGDEERANTFCLTSRRSVVADTLSAESARASASFSATSASNTGLIVSCAIVDEEKTKMRNDAVFYNPGYYTYNLNKKKCSTNNNVILSGSPTGSFYYVNSMMVEPQLPTERQNQSDRTVPLPVDGYPCVLAQSRTDVQRTAGGCWSDNESILRQNNVEP